MTDSWFDGYAAGDFLPAAGGAEAAAYAQGYADCAGAAAQRVQQRFWEGYAEGLEDAAGLVKLGPDRPAEPCLGPSPRRRPLCGAALRVRPGGQR